MKEKESSSEIVVTLHGEGCATAIRDCNTTQPPSAKQNLLRDELELEELMVEIMPLSCDPLVLWRGS